MEKSGLPIAKRILVDTDVLIDVGLGVETARVHLEQLGQNADLAVSSVTQMELVVGCRNKLELRSLDRFLEQFEVISLSDAISRTAVQLLRRYRLSHGLLIPDALIAATAVGLNAPLSSKNQRDYRFIEELDLLPYP